MNKGTQRTGKQLVYFTDRASMVECTDDVIKILLPIGSKYCAHNMNFMNCFLNNTPPTKQQFILHWAGSHNQYEGFKQDVFEIITVQLTKDGGEREVHYVMPIPVFFQILNLPMGLLPQEWFDEEDGRREPLGSHKQLAEERRYVYNDILRRFCKKHDVTFHDLDGAVKKKSSYMRQLRAI